MSDLETNKITLFVNGNQYSQFTEITVKCSLESLASRFEFVAANEFSDDFPFSAFDNVVVKINDIPRITGFITKLRPYYSNDDHAINIIGFDITKNVVDTEISEGSQSTQAISFKKLIENQMKINGITDIGVVDKAGNVIIGSDDLSISSDTSVSLFDYFHSIAKKKQVLLTTDGLGNIVIYKNIAPLNTGLSLKNKRGKSNNTIKNAECPIDYDKRYKTIKVVSQSDSDTNINGQATDDKIKHNRTKTIITDLVYSIDDCNKLAAWEVNKRRIDSLQYKCEVAGYWAKENLIFGPDQFYHIEDDYCAINDTMLLKAIEYKYSGSDGAVSTLHFVAKDAYTLAPNPADKDDSLGSPLA
jgi:prophage tail gpP-like protein